MSAAVQQKPEIKIKLSVVKGPHLGQVFQLNKAKFTIGRGPENDIVLMNDPLISRSHAQVAIVDRDLEISNLSIKNAIYVQGESVQKWKIVNNTNFTVGDSEFCVDYDLGKAIAAVPIKKSADVLHLKAKTQAAEVMVPSARSKQNIAGVPANRSAVPGMREQQVMKPQAGVAPRQNQMGRPRPAPQNFDVNTIQNQQAAVNNNSIMAHPRFKIYLIAAILIGGAYLYLSTHNKNTRHRKIISTLKYEDEVNAKMVSQREVELVAEREARSKEKAKSPMAFRIDENFVRGMRDFQLGNYARAQEFFQVVLNLDPDHKLGKRYLYLSKVRFDELVQEKLMLGESYFKKHNFRMCESLYQQVVDMLNGKNNDQKFQLASKKARECELAAEGIR